MPHTTPPARTRLSPELRTTLLYFATFITLGMTTASLGPTLDALAAQTAARIDQVSWLFALRSLGYLLGALAAGRLYDRVRGHPLMALALLVMGAGVFLIPHIPLLWLLLAVLLLVGVGEGMADVGGNTLIVWLHGKKVGPYMNGLHFCFGLGALLAPVIVAQVVGRMGSITWVYGLIALSALPGILGFWRAESPAIQNQAATDGERSNSNLPGTGLITLLVLFFVLYVGAEAGFGGWIYLYAVEGAKIPPQDAAYITSGFWGAFTAGRLLSIAISARLRPKTALQIDYAGGIVAIAILLLWPKAVWAVWTGALLFGVSLASIFPTMITYTGARIPVTARLTGYIFLGATLGSMSLPWLVGQFFERVGPQFLIWSLMAVMLMAVVVLYLLNAAFNRLPDRPSQ